MFAIVLLGYRNSGKDSVFKEIDKQIKNAVNVKFGAFNKHVVANLLRVPYDWTEDKEWRTEEWDYGITPLDLIDSLFVYSQTNEKFQRLIDKATLVPLKNCELYNRVPIFTDVRRKRELLAVFNRFGYSNTCVFWIGGENTQEIGDQYLDELQDHVDVFFVKNTPPEEIADTVVQHCGLTELLKKPTLHISNLSNSRSFTNNLPLYEPLQPLLDKLEETVKSFGLGKEVVPALFNLVYSETPEDKLILGEITKDSFLSYTPSQHQHLIPKLREKANLLFHVKKGTRLIASEMETFTADEVIYDE